MTESAGETRIALRRRRLGDRWDKKKVVMKRDGKKPERETWHNGGDDDINTFQLDWTEK
jgi:hypothetical protein